MAYKIDGYEADDFLIEALREGSLNDAEARKLYSRMRQVANRRLEALGNSRFANTQAYLRNRGKYTPLSTISKSADPDVPSRDLAYKLADLYKFLNSKGGSVTGQQAMERQALETAHERGLDFLNANNLRDFGQYMEEARQKGYAKIYGSERVAELFRTATKKGFNANELFADFNFYMESKSEIDKLPKFKNEEMRTAENYRLKLLK